MITVAQAGPAYKVGNEFAPFHPQASHVDPDYRDGWNACYQAAHALRTTAKPGGVTTIEALHDIIGQHLTGLYVCGRAWGAWGCGTMGEDDFTPASETDFRVRSGGCHSRPAHCQPYSSGLSARRHRLALHSDQPRSRHGAHGRLRARPPSAGAVVRSRWPGHGPRGSVNREAKPGETLAVVTFANVQGLDSLLEVIHRIRREKFHEAPPVVITGVTA